MRLRRRRARADTELRRRSGSSSTIFWSRNRTAANRDWRSPHAGPHGSHRPHRRRLGRRPHAARRDRGDMATPTWPAGPPHEPGPAQADRGHLADQDRAHLHHPASPEIGLGSEPGDDHGGNALKFYCSVRLDIRKGKPIRRGRSWSATRPASRWSRTSCAAVPRGALRDPLRHGSAPGGRAGRLGETHGVLEKNGPGTRTRASSLPRGARSDGYMDENPQARRPADELLARVRAQLPGARPPAPAEESAAA